MALHARASVIALFVLICGVQLHFNNVRGDEQFEKKYAQVVKDLSIIQRDPRIDWNETLPKTPGYECHVNKSYNIPALGHELEFLCPNTAPSSEIPTSVHRLRPADIKVIGAMGDSLSAANGGDACFLPEVLFEYRGVMFSHGGDESFETNPTLANIMRKFNPNLKGYGVDIGRWDSEEAGLNVGYPGDVADDMPLRAEWLVSKMQAHPDVDYENDWKIVTLFIGGNDLCSWCRKPDRNSPENYVKHISDALMILHDQMPRTIVNVMGILNIYLLETLQSPICDLFHMIFCDCAMYLTDEEMAEFTAINKEYQTLLQADIESGRYDDKDDFTVVLQPFFHDQPMPVLPNGQADTSYFSPDCFHFSHKSHVSTGIQLWNNMMERVGEKETTYIPVDNYIKCPAEEFPYIYTNVNSMPNFGDPEPTTGRASSTPLPSVIGLVVLSCLAVILAALPK